MTNPPPKILAKLYKTPLGPIGSYVLRGTLPEGELIEVCANQHKGCETDPDFYLLIIPSEDSSPGEGNPDSDFGADSGATRIDAESMRR